MMCIIVGYILYWGIFNIGTYVILGGRHLLGGGRGGGMLILQIILPA